LAIVTVIGVIVAISILGLAIVNQARQDEAAPSDAIIVLGTAQWDGRPSSTYRARLDHAHSLYEQGYAELIVLTGGIAPGDVYSEAEVGANYLRMLGVPDGNLIEIPEGRNSLESLRPAASRLIELGQTEVIMVSDPFHMYRVQRIAADLGLEPRTSPTSTSPIRPGSPAEQRYVIREIFAYINYMFFES
jgi:uncharacterized SAM-binding protein YcdF (DUF218 family)